MAEALAKIKDGFIHPATTGDTDGSLLTALIEALTAGARLNVGQKGRTTYSPSNYTIGGGGDTIVDDHLAGIDDQFALKASTSHKDTHKSAGGDAFASGDLLEAVVKRLQVTGPTTLLMGAVADGKFLKRSGTGIIGDDPPGMSAHTLGGAYHTSDTLANLNTKISDATLDTNTASRPPSGSAGGDLYSSYPNPGVGKLKGIDVEGATPTDNDVLQYDSATGDWQHRSVEPQYDSGWFSVAYNNTYAKPHSIGSIPMHVQVWWGASSSPSTWHICGYQWHYQSEAAGRGIIWTADSTNVTLKTGTSSGSGCIDTYGTGGTRTYSGGGYARVMAWK